MDRELNDAMLKVLTPPAYTYMRRALEQERLRRMRRRRYDKRHFRTIAAKVPERIAAQFHELCAAHGTNANTAVKQFVFDCLNDWK